MDCISTSYELSAGKKELETEAWSLHSEIRRLKMEVDVLLKADEILKKVRATVRKTSAGPAVKFHPPYSTAEDSDVAQ